MFDIDDAMGTVVATASQPALAAIKLAWWRERLDALDMGEVPAEPRLRLAASELLPRGIRGADLSQLEDSWAKILRDDQMEIFMKGVASRGPLLFGLAARLLGVPADEAVTNAGHAFSTVNLARRGLTTMEKQTLRGKRRRSQRGARPLTALAALAYRDMTHGGPPFEPEGTPGRAWALLRHRLTGRLPHG